MITPFENKEAYKIVRKILFTRKAKVIKNIEKYFENLSMNTLLKSKKIEINDAYIIWVYACIFVDIEYNHDYSQCCLYGSIDYSGMYTKVRESIREEFNRKTLFFNKYLYDRSGILSYITYNLTLVAGLSSSYKSELMKQMNRISRAKGNEFKETLLDLSNNLRMCL